MTPVLPSPAPQRVGYVIETYPRFADTFIVDELLAHEAAGLELDIFSLHRTTDARFQDAVLRVRAAVTYLPAERAASQLFWTMVQRSSAEPESSEALRHAADSDVINVSRALSLAREVRRRGITHLHAHGGDAASVARLAARFAHVPFTFTTQAQDVCGKQIDRCDLREKLMEAAAVIAASDHTHKHLEAVYGSAAARVERIYHGLELSRFAYRSPGRRPPHVLAAGRLIEQNGFTHLIDACAQLAARGVAFTCSIVGTGRLRPQLQREVNECGLREVVTLHGVLPRHELIRLLRSALVFAAPCLERADDRDGVPMTLLEAMALGTPCVATPVSGIPEAVRPGVTGLLVPPRDAVALRASIERLLGDAALRIQLAERARLLIEQQFDVRRGAARLRDVFARSARVHHELQAAV